MKQALRVYANDLHQESGSQRCGSRGARHDKTGAIFVVQQCRIFLLIGGKQRRSGCAVSVTLDEHLAAIGFCTESGPNPVPSTCE